MPRVSLQDCGRRKPVKEGILRDGLGGNRLEEILVQEVRRFGKELREAGLTSFEEVAFGGKQRAGDQEKKSSSPSPNPFGLNSLSEVPSGGGERRTKDLPLPPG